MIAEKQIGPPTTAKALVRTRIFRTVAPAMFFATLTAQTATNGCASGPSSSGEDAETADAEFARYDITESGWLSGTELDACNCRQYDRDGDGEVTKAEFMAGRSGVPAPAAPSRPAQQAPAAAPQRQEHTPGAQQQTQPGVGGPRAGSYYVMSYGNPAQPPLHLGRLEILPAGRYRYSAGGTTGEGAFTYTEGVVRWTSGPFADYGWGGQFTIERDGKTHKIRLTRTTIATNSTD